MRTTKREVEAVFERLCATAGVVPFIDRAAGDPPRKHARYRRDADGTLHHNAGWSIDHNPTYGGYIVRGHGGNGTGEFHPLSEYRMPAGEFRARYAHGDQGDGSREAPLADRTRRPRGDRDRCARSLPGRDHTTGGHRGTIMHEHNIDPHTLWDRVDMTGGPDACWPWKLSLGSTGYGQLRHRTRTYKAHRVACTIAYGPAPKDAPQAIHSCDNPACCNPAHLRWGTQADNMRDMTGRNRRVFTPPIVGPGEDRPRARLTNTQVIDMRRARTEGTSLRALAERYGVSLPLVSMICSRRRWTHLP